MLSSFIKYFTLVHNVCARCTGAAKNEKACKASFTSDEVAFVQHVVAKKDSLGRTGDQSKLDGTASLDAFGKGLKASQAQKTQLSIDAVLVQYYSDVTYEGFSPFAPLLLARFFKQLNGHEYVMYTGGGQYTADLLRNGSAANCDWSQMPYAIGVSGTGWQNDNDRIDVQCGLHPGWGKVLSLKRALSSYPSASYFLYADIDTVVNGALLDSPMSLPSYYTRLGSVCGFGEEPRLLAARETEFWASLLKADEKINDGVIILKSAEPVKKLVEAWLESSLDPYHTSPIHISQHEVVPFRTQWPHCAYNLNRLLADSSYHGGAGLVGVSVPAESNVTTEYIFQKCDDKSDRDTCNHLPWLHASPTVGDECRNAVKDITSASAVTSFLQSLGADSRTTRSSSVFDGRAIQSMDIDTGSCSANVKDAKEFCDAIGGGQSACDLTIDNVSGAEKGISIKLSIGGRHFDSKCSLQCELEHDNSDSMSTWTGCYFNHYPDQKDLPNEWAKGKLQEKFGWDGDGKAAVDALQQWIQPL